MSLLHKGGESGTSIADMPDDETICGCNGVDKGTIVNAITTKGLTTVDEVTKQPKQEILVVSVKDKLEKY